MEDRRGSHRANGAEDRASSKEARGTQRGKEKERKKRAGRGLKATGRVRGAAP